MREKNISKEKKFVQICFTPTDSEGHNLGADGQRFNTDNSEPVVGYRTNYMVAYQFWIQTNHLSVTSPTF
jgi:hypothetical protein